MSDERSLAIIDKPYELSVLEVKNQVQKIQACMKELMVEGTHYGESFPGDTKKNLLKPGADKLCFMFRFRAEFKQDTNDLPGGHREIYTSCQIFHIESGAKIAEGVGLCSTMESKYRWRNAARVCPECGQETIIKGKEEYGGGFVCFKKKGGCGAKFEDGDERITSQKQGKVENPDIADVYNTVAKISKKRAYVDATISACAASDLFTQDIEDISGNHESDHQEGSRPGNSHAKDSVKESPIAVEFRQVQEDIRDTMLAKRADGTNVFSDQDVQIVKEKTKGLRYIPDDLSFLKSLLDVWQKKLREAMRETVIVKDNTSASDEINDDDIPFEEPDIF